MPANRPDDGPRIIKVDFRNRHSKPVEQPTRHVTDATENYQEEILAVERAEAVLRAFMQFFEQPQEGVDCESISAPLLAQINFANRFNDHSRGYRPGVTYAETMAGARYHTMAIEELAQILDNGAGSWKSKPQFYHAIATILNQKLQAEAGGDIENMPVNALVKLLDVTEAEWQKNLRRYFTLAFNLRKKLLHMQEQDQK